MFVPAVLRARAAGGRGADSGRCFWAAPLSRARELGKIPIKQLLTSFLLAQYRKGRAAGGQAGHLPEMRSDRAIPRPQNLVRICRQTCNGCFRAQSQFVILQVGTRTNADREVWHLSINMVQEIGALCPHWRATEEQGGSKACGKKSRRGPCTRT